LLGDIDEEPRMDESGAKGREIIIYFKNGLRVYLTFINHIPKLDRADQDALNGI
jgi:hypothetical protein